MHVNYLGGLSKVVGHVRVAGSTDGMDYEPALYLINETSPRFAGRSFIIALSALHKYVEPFVKYNDPRFIEADKQDFERVKQTCLQQRQELEMGMVNGIVIPMTPESRDVAIRTSNEDIAAIMFAEMLARSNGILLKTGYNLARAMQMFDIPPIPSAAAQLLIFIEDSLDDLRTMGPPIPDTVFTAGGYQMRMGGEKVASGDIEVTDTELSDGVYANSKP
jgi:hypothetical protein